MHICMYVYIYIFVIVYVHVHMCVYSYQNVSVWYEGCVINIKNDFHLSTFNISFSRVRNNILS